MRYPVAVCYSVLATLLDFGTAGSVNSCLQQICQSHGNDCAEDESLPPGSPPVPPNPLPPPVFVGCLNRPAAGQKWACQADNIDFPTVQCLIADIKTCGVFGQNTVFYSYGIKTVEARTYVRDTLTPKGFMFNDGLMSDVIGESSFYNTVLTMDKFGLKEGMGGPTNNEHMNRNDIFVRRYSEALASVASGEVFIVVSERNGRGGGRPGAYQTPWINPAALNPLDNVWLIYEFPTLQRNEAITKITSVDKSNNYLHTTDWKAGDQLDLPPSPAMNLMLPQLAPKCNDKSKRDDGTCDTGCGPSSISGTATITIPPTPSCSLQNEDPDQGIDSQYCVCQGSVTLPLLSAPAAAIATESCAYTTLPGSTISPTRDLGPPVTYSSLCQVCTPLVVNEDSCSTITSCIPQVAQATVQAGSSPVHVGTLTGTALYTSISSALNKICPTVSQTRSATICETSPVVIQGIDYVDSGYMAEGELIVQVDSSAYNVTSLRDAMIQSAALTAQQSAQGNNCYLQPFTAAKSRKRDYSTWHRLHRRARQWFDTDIEVYDLEARAGADIHPEQITLCNAVEFAGVNYYSQYWRLAPEPGSTDYIDARWSFEVGPGGQFDCEFLQGLIDSLVVVAPEFAVEDVELGESVGAICQAAMDHVGR